MAFGFIPWIRSLIAIAERREYDSYRVLSFAFFVGVFRSVMEWVLLGLPINHPVASLFINITFYWMVFYSVAVVLKWTVAPPWENRVNIILVGLFLGLFPPLIDLVAYGPGSGIHYDFFRHFPHEWKPYFLNPEHHITVGETAAIWMMIALTATYVWVKTNRFSKAAIGFVLAYAVAVVDGGFAATLTSHWHEWFHWRGPNIALIGLLQLGLTLGLYTVLRPRVARGLMRRAPHTIPFVLITLVGSAFAGGVQELSFLYAALVGLLAVTCVVQNDYFDARAEGRKESEAEVDHEDVKFFNITAVLAAGVLLSLNSPSAMLFLLIFITLPLYNYPFYRGRNHFPANLKIEGVWGLASFLVGAVAAKEYAPGYGPGWWFDNRPDFLAQQMKFTPAEMAAALLVFGGFSAVAALKDQKDAESDSIHGVRTLYSIALRRGWSLQRVHFRIVLFSAACVGVAFPLLYAAERVTFPWIFAGIPFAGGLLLFDPKPTRRGFYAALSMLTLLLGLVLITLTVGQ